jgi:hypothetical protein
MQRRSWKAWGMILAVAFLLGGSCAVSGWTEEPEVTKYTLTITDGWGLLDHLSQVAVHAVVEAEAPQRPVATNNSPSNPVTFLLPPGTYTVTLIADMSGVGRVSWTSDPILLDEKKTLTLPTPSDE